MPRRQRTQCEPLSIRLPFGDSAEFERLAEAFGVTVPTILREFVMQVTRCDPDLLADWAATWYGAGHPMPDNRAADPDPPYRRTGVHVPTYHDAVAAPPQVATATAPGRSDYVVSGNSFDSLTLSGRDGAVITNNPARSHQAAVSGWQDALRQAVVTEVQRLGMELSDDLMTELDHRIEQNMRDFGGRLDRAPNAPLPSAELAAQSMVAHWAASFGTSHDDMQEAF